jgi:hypothetical protein
MVNNSSGWNPAAGLRGGQRPPYGKPLPKPSITDNWPRPSSPESPLPVNVPLGRPLPPTPPGAEKPLPPTPQAENPLSTEPWRDPARAGQQPVNPILKAPTRPPAPEPGQRPAPKSILKPPRSPRPVEPPPQIAEQQLPATGEPGEPGAAGAAARDRGRDYCRRH